MAEPGTTRIPGSAIGSWLGDRDAGSDWSVVVVGDHVLVGQPDPGRVVVLTAALEPVDEVAGPSPEFGAALAVDRRGGAWDVWVGAPGHERGRGAVFVYRDVLAGGVPELGEPGLVLEGGVAFDRLGEVLARCPDRTGDGRGEMLLGAPTLGGSPSWPHAPFEALAGAVFLLPSESLATTGTMAPWDLGSAWWGAGIGHGAGTAVACDEVGVYVGAPWRSEDPPAADPNAVRGAVYVIEGVPASGPLEEVSTQRVDGRAADEWFGASLATLQIDGERQLLVGGPGHAGGAGRASVHALGKGGEVTLVTEVGPAPEHPLLDHLGRTVGAGDIDGDGDDDLLVASPDYREGRTFFDLGRLWVFPGGGDWPESLTTNNATHVVEGTEAFLRVGRRMHVADVDGDGIDELWLPTRAPTPDREP